MTAARKQIERAERRAGTRDNKRRKRMSVTGKGVFALARILRQPKKG